MLNSFQITQEILELNQILRNKLEEGFDLSEDYIIDLSDLLTEEVVNSLPNTKYNDSINSDLEELRTQFEEGMEGIREIESLVEAIFKAHNKESEYTGDMY
jgi:hypothetical protein